MSKTRRFLIIDIILLFLGFAGVYHIIFKAGLNPETDIVISSGRGRIVFEEIYHPALYNIIAPGDTLITCAAIPVTSWDAFETVCDGFATEDSVEIVLKRGGDLITAHVRLPVYYSNFYIVTVIVVGLIFWIFGVFVLVKRPEDIAARLYHWVSVTVAVLIMTTWGRYTIFPIGTGHGLRVIFSAAYSFTPAIFVHFSLLYPFRKNYASRKLISLFYGLAVFFTIASGATFLISVIPEISEKVRYFVYSFQALRLFFLTCIFLAVANFLHSYYTAPDETTRKKLRWMILGYVLGPLCFVLLWQIPQMFGFIGRIPEELILILITILPITFSISLIRYQIMDIDLLLNRSTVYIIVLILAMILYAFVVVTVSLIAGVLTVEASLAASALAAVIIGLLFEPIKRNIQKQVDKRFFRVQYNYRIAQRRFSSAIKECIGLEDLSKLVVRDLEELLIPEKISLVLYSSENLRSMKYDQRNWPDLRPNTMRRLTEGITSRSTQIIADPDQIEAGITFERLDKNTLPSMEIALMVPVKSQESAISGLLMLGQKKSGTRYSQEDVDLITTICLETGLAAERIRLNRNLILKSEEAKKLEELNQKISYFVSSVTHEFLTPLTAIKLNAELMRSKSGSTASELEEHFRTIEGQSDKLTRLVSNVLDFSKIDRESRQYQFETVDLCEILKHVLGIMKYELNEHQFEIKSRIPGQPVYIHGDENALRDAVINIISNSIKYSAQDKYIFVGLTADEKQAVAEISDHGIGIDSSEQKRVFESYYRAKDKKSRSVGGAGLGLTLVKHTIEAHNGKIKLQSRPGHGTTIKLIFPI